MKRLILGLLLLLVSCGSPELSTPAPTQEAITVYFPSALKPWAEKISACSSNNPLIGLYFNSSPFLEMNFQNTDISLHLGEPAQIKQPSYLSQIGWEQLVVIVNQQNDLSRLSTDRIQSVYSGETLNWENDAGQPIQVWVLPEGDPARKPFDLAILPSKLLASEARLAPDSEAMLEAVASDLNAIGYLPGSVLSVSDPYLISKLKVVQLEDSLQEKFRLPVVALTQEEPEGLLRELLTCTQAASP